MESMSNPNVFTITAEIKYRPFRTPPRCRKPRQVQETFKHTLAIPSVTSVDAPTVALVPNDRGLFGAPGGGEAEIRSFDGKLWTVETETRDCTSPAALAGSDLFPADVTLDFHLEDADEAAEHFTSRYQDYLIVDGVVWRQTAEPVYSVETLGWGGNHGGTYMDIEVLVPGKREDRTFTLVDYDAAVAGALAIATDNGDDQSFERIRRTPGATILDPSAFRVPGDAVRIAKAESEVRQRASAAAALLQGRLTQDVLKEAKQAIKDMEAMFWKHGLDMVEPAGR